MTIAPITVQTRTAEVSVQDWRRPLRGNMEAPVVVVCEPPTAEAIKAGLPMPAASFKLFADAVFANGMVREDFLFVSLCPPMPKNIINSDSKRWKHVEPHVEEIWTRIRATNPRCIIPLGKEAARVVIGRPVAITKARGKAVRLECGPVVLPMLSPAMVLRVPDHHPTFVTDTRTLGHLKEDDYVVSERTQTALDYRWCEDLSELLELHPGAIAVDTETTGLRWYDPEVEVITVQITYAPGKALVCPVDRVYWPEWNDRPRAHKKLLYQLKALLEDPTIKKIGHNLKFDVHMLRKLGIEVSNWSDDTQLKAFAVDENMMEKSLDECTRRWVPEMAGYADCVAPNTLVLTKDMRKVRAGDLGVGDELCAFTAETDGRKAARRRLEIAVVQGVQRLRRSCLRITTESGRQTTVSAGHLMLCKRGLGDRGGGWRWRRADRLTIGSILKPFPWEDPSNSYDAGYVAGVFDGEGWVRSKQSRIGIAQRGNACLAKFIEVVQRDGFVSGHRTDQRREVPVVNVTFDGHDAFRMLQRYRPLRLLANGAWYGCCVPTNGERYDRIVDIEDVGEQEVIGLKTSTQTIIADGLLSHNSFNQTTDKSKMREVPRDKMLLYAGGDSDAAFRLDEVLTGLLARDYQQERIYRLVQMPAMRTFANTVERFGMVVDQQRLQEFGDEVRSFLRDAYPGLISRVPAAVRRAHLEAGKELKFSRPDFVRDTLFSQSGFNLEPVVFTKGTRDEDDAALKVASTSSKDHLPFFADPASKVGQFVIDLIDFQKTTKLEGSFIGSHNLGNGLWQYLSSDGRIFPSYMLHRTVTGRTASAEPNGQNFPKRGRWAKPYQSIFKARPGFKLVNCDLSQIELRLIAWKAKDQAMLKVYRDGGDIHTTTAQYISGVSEAQWNSMDSAARKLARFRAKAANFGLCYGMGAKKFRAYAKTDYGVDYTERESYETRDRFFALYSALPQWHDAERQFVRNNGYVRALHGAVRHLPSIWSNDEKIRAESERQAINSPIQRFGSDLGLMAMARFSAQANPELFRIIGFVHDALVMEVRDGFEREGIEALLYAMQSTPLHEWFGITPPLPIIAEADIGISGGQMLEFADLPPVDERPEWFNDMGFDRVAAVKPDWWDDVAEEEWVHIHLTN